eukprot:535065-Alexandrium_andersonii.AAC.1
MDSRSVDTFAFTENEQAVALAKAASPAVASAAESRLALPAAPSASQAAGALVAAVENRKKCPICAASKSGNKRFCTVHQRAYDNATNECRAARDSQGLTSKLWQSYVSVGGAL